MSNQDRERQDFRNDAPETRLQVDPMLRPGRVPWGWTMAMAGALVAIAVVLFATNRDDSEVAETPSAETPVTSGAGPAPSAKQDAPARQETTGQAAPPIKDDAAGAPAGRGTTGSGERQ